MSERVHLPKASELVAERVRRRILSGELKDGDTLPPEAQLVATLGVSRPTLREALRVLEGEGFLRIMRGSRSGALIRRPGSAGVARQAGYALQAAGATIGDAYAARLAIEPFLVRAIAQQRASAAIERLRGEYRRLVRLIDGGHYGDFIAGLDRFHRAIAEVSGQRTLLLMTDILQRQYRAYQREWLATHRLGDEERQRYVRSGLKSVLRLIELVEAGNADGAEAHWRLHLTNANRAWLGREGAARPLSPDAMA
ncbi:MULTISPECIES: FadR/GntR family transcriptional regulator [unclassified Sphingomonas]|uniref:FadR/GntR family transcriptional regulator n=1 Tax=unclassified Sphingomonas TaxID=196159 RepID=UPI00082C18D5|nr:MULTISPECIES: GntR family transcriptional regulator [unclassified Sphingomonas]